MLLATEIMYQLRGSSPSSLVVLIGRQSCQEVLAHMAGITAKFHKWL